MWTTLYVKNIVLIIAASLLFLFAIQSANAFYNEETIYYNGFESDTVKGIVDITTDFSGSYYFGTVVKYNNEYYYFSGDNEDLYVSKSVDGKTFGASTKIIENGGANEWDHNITYCPQAWVEGNNWYILYGGTNRVTEDNRKKVGLATYTGSDPISGTWTKAVDNPVFNYNDNPPVADAPGSKDRLSASDSRDAGMVAVVFLA
jgi:hypothetical protein